MKKMYKLHLYELAGAQNFRPKLYFLFKNYPEPYANVNTSIQIFPVCALPMKQS
jgi:hypothetical protein